MNQKNKAHATILKMGGGAIFERLLGLLSPLGPTRSAILKVNDWGMTRQFVTLSDKIFSESQNA